MVKKIGEIKEENFELFCEKVDSGILFFLFSTILFLFSTRFSTFISCLLYLGFPLLNISTNTT